LLKQTKIGTNRGKPRVWLQGATLTECGFKRGMKFRIEISAAKLVIELSQDGDRHVSGKPGIPIIDIATPKLLEVAPMGAPLSIDGSEGRIVLKPMKGGN
jgi:DNA (cytosine-5)-methyltransferase 1